MRNYEDRDNYVPVTSSEPSTSSAPPGPTVPLIELDSQNENVQRRMMADQTKAQGNGGTAYPHYGNCTKYTIDTEDRCSACSSFRNGPCLLSNDHQTRTSYISSEGMSESRF
uniref:Uncharacterized protein n=1 Tax=Caenorhabditis japonica TaxID=281687 RepID=A0A8R1ESN1_CAEJA